MVRGKGRKAKRRKGVAFCVASAAVVCAALLYPFIALAPVVVISPQDMPQQVVILKASNFFYDNYNAVPKNCLVFSFTPDLWYGVNVSSAQVDYASGGLNGSDAYSCKVLDYGYWCVVPPYRNTTCEQLMKEYSTAVIASNVTVGTAFYRMLNYS